LISDAECRTISNMDARVECDTNAASHADLKLEVTGHNDPRCDMKAGHRLDWNTGSGTR